MSDSDNSPNVEIIPTREVISALKDETDKAHQTFKEALNEGDVDAADAAYITYRDVDNTRLRFDRAVEAAKEVLDSSE